MNKKFDCNDNAVISGYDPHSLLQHQIYICMAALNIGSAIALILYFFIRVRKHDLSNKIYLVILYVSICFLYIVKGFFYFGGEKVIPYGFNLYRFLSFLPPFIEGGCFLIYCLGLQEMLVREQEAESGPELDKCRRVRFMTFIFLGVYGVSYIGVYILNIIVLHGTSAGKNVYFIYRLIAAILIAILAMWTTNKVRKSLAKYKDLYEKAITRNIIMAGCLILHCLLKIVTSILFITDAIIDVKCHDYNNDGSCFYVGYLSLYHMFNEYVPCMVIVVLMSIQLSTYDKLHEEPRHNTTFSEDLANMEKNASANEKLRKSLVNLDDTLNDN